jgi:hypothetical protein
MYWDDSEFPDCKLIMAVAQEPFESSGNRFATLVPIIWSDGAAVNRADFTNNGLVWWKVPDGFQRADPGRLMTGAIERAPAWDDSPDKSRYQTKFEVTDIPGADEMVEIVEINNPAVVELKNLLARGVSIEMDHAPTAICLVRFDGFLYGPHARERCGESAKIQTMGSYDQSARFKPRGGPNSRGRRHVRGLSL